jgi:hypothetical protein
MHKYGCVRVCMTRSCVCAPVCVKAPVQNTCHAMLIQMRKSSLVHNTNTCIHRMYTTHTPPTNKVQSQDQSGDNTSIHREAKHLQLTKSKD